MNRSEGLERLRTQQLGETIIYFHAADTECRLEGIVPARWLLMSAPHMPIASLIVNLAGCVV